MAITRTTLLTAAAILFTKQTKFMQTGIQRMNSGVETRRAAARTSQEEPRTCGSSQEGAVEGRPGTASSSQEQPEAARSSPRR